MSETAATVSGARFAWPVRVYYEDTDAGGVVYHANYVKFMERARTEWLRALGFEQDRLREEYGIVFAVRRFSLELRRAARFNDVLEVTCAPEPPRRVSLEFDQAVWRQQEVLATGRVGVACVDIHRFVPAALPEPVRQAVRAAADMNATG